MLGLEPSMHYFFCEGKTDMRKGIDTLAEEVRKRLRMDPTSGYVFIFISKNRRHVKILRYESNVSYCIGNASKVRNDSSDRYTIATKEAMKWTGISW